MSYSKINRPLMGVLAAGCALAALPALADTIWYDGRWIDTRHLASWQIESARDANRLMGLLRIAMMIGATAIGFGIGWFCSPQAQTFRRIIVAGICIVVGLYALGDPTPWGWSAATLIALLGFCWGLGYWMGQAVQSFFDVPTTFGSSHWATQEDMEDADLFGSDGIILGEAVRDAVKQVFSYKGDRHMLTVAPTRAWKGVSHITPNLLNHKGSVLVIDVKGENAMITAKARREMGQEIVAVDPWNISGEETSCINPMDWLSLSDEDAPDNAMQLADSIVRKDGHGDKFWAEEATALLQGVMLHVAFDEQFEGERHLGTLRDLLLLPEDQMQALFQEMAGSPHHIVASTGSRSLQKDPKLMANVLASALSVVI